MDAALKRRMVIAAVVVTVLVAGVLFLGRSAPRRPSPLALDAPGIDAPTVIRDGRGRPIISNFRTVEPKVLYRGSAFPTSFPKPGGGSEYADQTAFNFLRSLNVRHVLAMLDTPEAYYAEDGYLKYWSEKTGFTISTTWVQIDPTEAFGDDERGGLRGAGILIALMREDVARGGAVYVHDIHGVSHAGVAVAGYELWRNRGWVEPERAWTLVERRFLEGNRTMQDLQQAGAAPQPALCPGGQRAFVCVESLRNLRERLRFVIEL
jgi:hypothetical protein